MGRLLSGDSLLATLWVFLGLCSVGTSQVVVPSMDISFNDETDIIQEGSAAQAFDFNVIIRLDMTSDTADVDGVIDRWSLSLEVQDSSGTACSLSVDASLTPAQSGVAIGTGGSGVISGVTANFDLTNCLCSSATQLVVTLSSNRYTLSPVSPKATGNVICNGLIANTLTILAGGASLVENVNDQTVELTIMGNSESQGRSVVGNSNWAVQVFLATGDHINYTPIESTQTEATVPLVEANRNWAAGGTLALREIMVTLNLTGVGSCDRINVLCTSLYRNPASVPEFSIEDGNITSCMPVVCIGVLINQVIPAFTSDTKIRQGEEVIDLQLTVTIKADSTKASITGTNLWQAYVFGNADADCMHPTKVARTMVDLREGTNYGLDVNSQSVWSLLTASLNMAEHSCSDARFICVEVLKGSNPTPDFSLSFSPESSRYGAVAVGCQELVVANGSLNVISATLAAYKENHMMQFDASFTSEADSGGASGTNLWKLVAFPAQNSDGTGNTGPETPVPLSNAQLNTRFPGSGGSLMLNGLTATISLVSDPCGTYRYLCAKLSRKGASNPAFGISPDSVFACSQELTCQNVRFTSVAVSPSGGSSPNGLPLFEGVGAQDIYFDVVLESDATAGSVPSGTSHWQFTVLPGSVPADLTDAQRDAMLTAGTDLTFTRVMATLDLTNQLCASLNTVSVEIMSSSTDTLGFQIDSPSAQNIGFFTPTCQGVEIRALVINDGVTNFALKEGMQDHTMIFSVGVTTNPDAGSLRGENLWKMLVYLSPDTSNSRLVSADAMTGNWESQDLIAGEATTFSDVEVSLDLNTKCTNMQFLCVELRRADGKEFRLDEMLNTLQTCKLVPQCKGVEVASIAVALASGDSLVEGVAANTPVVEVSLEFADTSASVTGTNVWNVTIYGSDNGEGTGDRIEEQKSVTSGDSVAGETRQLDGITWNVDMSGMLCVEVTYICVVVKLVADAPFSLLPTSYQRCSPVPCQGIVITSEDFTFSVPAEIFEAKNSNTQVLTIDTITVQAEGNGAEIPVGNTARIWEVSLFLNSAADGTGQTFDTDMGVLSNADQMMGIRGGSQLTFTDDLRFQFNLDVMCGQALYACLEISESAKASTNYDITFPATPKCKLISCVGIVFSSAYLTHPADTLIIENEPAHPVRVTFQAETAPISATLGQGSNFWRLSVFANTESDGSGPQRYGEALATLSQVQQNTLLHASDIIEFANVDASLDLDGFVCPSDMVYLCAELQRNSMSRTPFTIQGTPSPLVACEQVECQGVLITSIDIDGAPPNVFENEANPMTLDVTVGLGGADASGTNLWRMNASLVYNGMVLDVVDVDLGDQANAAVVAGQSITFSDLPLPFDLTDIVCPGIGSVMLCVELSRGGSTDANFTVSGVTRKCNDLPCLGVVIVQSAVSASTGSLLEGRGSNAITLDVSYSSKLNGASIDGTNLWAITVFGNSRSDGLGPPISKTTGTLQGNDASFPLPKGDRVEFNDIAATLDLSTYRVCEEVRWVCAELTKGDNPSKNFSLSDNRHASIACTSLDCTGVQISDTVLAISSSDLTEDFGNHMVTVDSITITGGSGSSTLPHSDTNFKVVIFGNSMEDTSGMRVALTMVDISGSQQDVSPGAPTLLSGMATLDLTGVFCSNLNYLCVEVYRADDPLPPFNFKLEGVPNENSLINCVAVTCKGVRVIGGSVVTSSVLLEGKPDHPVEVTVNFDTADDGASVRPRGMNLFKLVGFLSATADGGDPKSAEQNVTHPSGSKGQPVMAGSPITFVGAVAMLDTTRWICQDDNFICIRLLKESSVDYLLEGWDNGMMSSDPGKLQQCFPITCRGVSITNVIISADDPLSFTERNDPDSVTVNIGLVPDPDAGGVMGYGLWSLTVALNNMWDGSGNQFGTETVVTLSEENENQAVDPAVPRTDLTGVSFDLPLERVLCSEADPFYLCIKLEKASGSMPDFSLTVADWNCTLIECYPVVIRDLSVKITSPEVILENAVNELRIDLSVATDPMSAEISGTVLWAKPSVQLLDAIAVTTLSASGAFWSLDLQNMALSSNETAEFKDIFPVTFMTTGIVCSDLRQLCMFFDKGADPMPAFGVEFSSLSYVCVDVECRGVEIVSTVISSITEGGTVTERATVNQLVTLSLRSTSSVDGASISGTDLWNVLVYYSSSTDGDFGDIVTTLIHADLNEAQRNMDLMAGDDLILDNVERSALDLSDLVCPNSGLYLCARLERHPSPSPLFTLSAQDGDPSALIGCKSVTCIGVEMEETTLVISDGMLIPVEKPVVPHTVSFSFKSTPSPRSAELNGMGLWKLIVFANRREDGSHFRQSNEKDVMLSDDQRNLNVLSGFAVIFGGVSVDLDLRGTDTECRETAYFCGKLLKGEDPMPKFSLQGSPDDSVLINCKPLDCNGVKITLFDLTNTGSDNLRENADNQLFTFDVSLTSDAAKDDISGDDLWTFRAFLNNADDCLGGAGDEVARTTANVSPGQADQDLGAGGNISFNINALLSYRMKCPSWDKVYICLEVFEGDATSTAFTLFGDILKGVQIECGGVEVTDTVISEVNMGMEIVESDDSVTFDLNLRISSDADASGTGILGTGLWSVEIYISDEDTCQMATSDRVNSTLSVTNRNKALVAGVDLVMNNVLATVPMQGVLCEDIKYVCAVLGKGPSPSPDFTLVPKPDSTSLIASSENMLVCRGLDILYTRLELTSGAPLVSNDPQHPIAFDLILETNPLGTSLSNPTNLFRIQVAATDSPTRAGVVSSKHQVVVNYSPPGGFQIAAGQRYTLPVQASLNLGGGRCDEIPYICITLMKGFNAEPPFTLTPDVDDPILTACSERLDCVGVKITNEGLDIESGIPFLEHAMSNPVELTVTLGSADGSADAIGTNLWSAEVKLSLEDPLDPGTKFLAVTTGTFLRGNASMDLENGEMVSLRLEANLNLMGISCSDVRYLVVNITNPNANPEFTLDWRDGLEYVVVAQAFTCSGVSFVADSLMISDGFPLRELALSSNVTFSVGIMVTAASATVTGENLWAVRAFVTDDPNSVGIPEDEKEDADLTPAQGAVAINANAVSNINNVEVALVLTDKYCSDMTYLCVEVWRGDSAQPYYRIEVPASQSDLRICEMTQCTGVEVTSVILFFDLVPPLIEMRPNQEVRLNVYVTATPESASIDGDNLWAVTVFVNSQLDGSGTRRSVREAVIAPSEGGKDLGPDSVLFLEDLVASMDFTGIPCSQMAFICVTLAENDQAQPDFNLAGGDVLTNCGPTHCISVAIASGTLSLVSNEILEGDSEASFMLDASFMPWSNSRSLQEDDSWRLVAYIMGRSDTEVTLTDDQQNQEVAVGTPLAFNGRDVTLDVSTQSCTTTTHLCVELIAQAGVSFEVGGYPTSASLLACAVLLCFPKQVDLYSVEVTERRIRVEFSEAFGDFDLYVLSYFPPNGITTSPVFIPRNLQRSLDFNGLVPGQEYTIQLRLRDGATDKTEAFELVERTRPDPVELQLEDVTSSELSVSWDEATPVFEYYIILLEPSDNGFPPTPLKVLPAADRQVTFNRLLTARQYNVTIYTVSGNSQSLSRSVIANTDPSTPFLDATGMDETTVDLEWFIDPSYIVNQYEIRHEPDDGMPQPIIFSGETNQATLENLRPGRMYVISLVAVSNISGVIQIRSSPAEMPVQLRPVPPAEITYQDPSETSIQIEWPSAEGEVDYYKVVFSPSVDQTETEVLQNAPREVPYQGLEVASEYTITISTHVAAVSGELVSLPIRRTVHTLPYPPDPLSIVQVTTTTIEFQWQNAAGPRDIYKVTFDPNEPEFSPQSPYFTKGTSMLLTGIKPHVTVDFEVRTKFGDVVSRPQKLRQRTFPTLPGPVRDFKITSVDSDNIQIAFKVPEDPNGLIIAYLVSVEGTKPGEPSESAFQTITALPNDVQFEEIISPLKAGYTYTLSIQATNTEGTGEPVVLSPVTLPIKAPYFSGQILLTDDFFVDVTSSTITIRIPNSLFSDRNGVVTAYTVLVVGATANLTAGAILPNYQEVRNFAVKPVYQTSEPLDLFNLARRRRQAIGAESVDFVIGEETPCPSFGYCNGPLDAITQYRVRVRAATENGLYTDIPWSDVITTTFDPWWFIYALIPFLIVVLIIAFIMCLCFCVADKKKPPKKQASRRRKTRPVPEQQEQNMNASNNVVLTSTSQEDLTPDTPPPKRSATSRPVAVVNFGQHVRKMAARTGYNFAKEFKDLNLIGETLAKTAGALPENVEKNRYGNIVPFDGNRVCLNKDEDYINASLMSGFSGDSEYIATQGPQANTVNDFWQMVWEQNVPAIAVIGSCVEKGRVKFAQYWPSDSRPITFGDVTVNRVSEREETERGYIVRELCLESGSEVRSLRQFQFTAWPDHGVPKKSDQMLHFIRTVRSQLPENAGPLVVHCGAGIGRTGVFIMLDVLTQQLALDEYIDVFGAVASKREERTNMVQTEHQYEFVHRALLDILEGRVTGPHWTLKSKRRVSIDSDQRVEEIIAEATM